ncbi:MAG: PTS sugar transporter subunit IIA [Alphaproteobacteria bacterium]|nr:PTS sugar transporter subunit IIA [Alphaproteobacteria bacterium]
MQHRRTRINRGLPLYVSDDERLSIDLILPDLKAPHITQAYQTISNKVDMMTGFPARTLFTQLMTREQHASSGIGEGVAIPHLRLPKLQKPFIIMARLARPVDFNAVDDYPVDLIMMLLSPGSDGPHHLRRLSRISRLMRNPALLEDLRSAADADGLRSLLDQSSQRLLAAA